MIENAMAKLPRSIIISQKRIEGFQRNSNLERLGLQTQFYRHTLPRPINGSTRQNCSIRYDPTLRRRFAWVLSPTNVRSFGEFLLQCGKIIVTIPFTISSYSGRKFSVAASAVPTITA